MGNRSFTVEIETQEEYRNIKIAEETLPGILGFEPCFYVCGAMELKGKFYVLVGFNCSTSSAWEAAHEIKSTYHISKDFKQLESYSTEETDTGSRIIGADYFESEEAFYNKLEIDL